MRAVTPAPSTNANFGHRTGLVARTSGVRGRRAGTPREVGGRTRVGAAGPAGGNPAGDRRPYAAEHGEWAGHSGGRLSPWLPVGHRWVVDVPMGRSERAAPDSRGNRIAGGRPQFGVRSGSSRWVGRRAVPSDSASRTENGSPGCVR